MIRIYRFFKSHRWVFWIILLSTSVLMAALASRIELEEDISKLLPETESSKSVGLAFSNLKVKDKLFVQVQQKQGNSDPDTLAAACDLFVESLLQQDSADQDIDPEVLYQVDGGMMMEPLMFLTEHLPTFVDVDSYSQMDQLLSPEHLQKQMAENFQNEMEEKPGAAELAQQDPIGLRSLLTGMDASAAKKTQQNMPMTILSGHIFTSDSLTCMAFMNPNFKSMDSGSGTRMVGKLEAAAECVSEQYPNVEVLFHGTTINSYHNSHRIKLDLLTTIGISLILICLLIAICFRNWGSLPMLLLPVVYGALFALSSIYLIHGKMSLMALGLGAIVLGVALSYCLHVLTHYKYVSDPEQVIREQQKPVFMGSLTTVGAFAGLLFTDSALLQDFGLFALLSIIGTTVASLCFMPQFFRPETNRKSERAFRWMERINSYPFDRQNWLLVTITLCAVLCIAFSGQVRFDSDLKNLNFFNDQTVRAQKQWSEKTQAGYKNQYYAVSANNLDSALQYNIRMHQVCEGLKNSGQIVSYAGMTDRLLVDQQTQQERIQAWHDYFTPERVAKARQQIEAAAQKAGYPEGYFETFEEMLAREDWEPASLYESGAIPNSLMSNLVEKMESEYLVFTAVKMDPKNLAEVNEVLGKQPHTIVVDPFYYTGSMVKIVQDDFNRILAISSLFVFLVLLCSFRNVFISIIAFIPMSVSWYVVLGTMALCGLQFNLINIVISTFIFGIGVDYSIFVMEGLLTGVKNSDNGQTLLYHKSAILLSAIVLIVCMASLLFAKHPAISSIGFSALVGMVSTIMITYTIEPFLFNLLVQTRFGKRVIEKTEK